MPVVLVAAAGIGSAEWWLYGAIRRQAAKDEAQPASAIVVFGAAQYNGTPSPVFKARLDHAFDLEERHMAPLVITTGAGGSDRRYTEAGVGRDYLIQQGMDAARILTDPSSSTTFQSVRTVARMLLERHNSNCIAVSDGFHLYRIKRMFHSQGIEAYGSPAPDSPIESDSFERTMYSLREALITTAWYLGYRG